MTKKGPKWPLLKLRFSDFISFPNWKAQFSKQIVIYVVAFDPIKIQTYLAPKNDCQNLTFVKDNNYVVGGKWPEMVVKAQLIVLYCF